MHRFNITVFCFLLLLIAIPYHSAAQRISFEGGILTGIYGVDISGNKEGFWNDEYDKSGILGFSAGPFVKCIFNPETYGVLELRYIRKGTTYGYINKYFTQSFETIKFDCIEVPVLYGVNSVLHSKGGDINFSIETGFAFSKLFSSRLKYDALTRRETPASLSGFKNYDISWVAQVKLPYRTGKKHTILLGIRMERSIVSIHKEVKLFNFDYGFELNYLFKNL